MPHADYRAVPKTTYELVADSNMELAAKIDAAKAAFVQEHRLGREDILSLATTVITPPHWNLSHEVHTMITFSLPV